MDERTWSATARESVADRETFRSEGRFGDEPGEDSGETAEQEPGLQDAIEHLETALRDADDSSLGLGPDAEETEEVKDGAPFWQAAARFLGGAAHGLNGLMGTLGLATTVVKQGPSVLGKAAQHEIQARAENLVLTEQDAGVLREVLQTLRERRAQITGPGFQESNSLTSEAGREAVQELRVEIALLKETLAGLVNRARTAESNSATARSETPSEKPGLPEEDLEPVEDPPIVDPPVENATPVETPDPPVRQEIPVETPVHPPAENESDKPAAPSDSRAEAIDVTEATDNPLAKGYKPDESQVIERDEGGEVTSFSVGRFGEEENTPYVFQQGNNDYGQTSTCAVAAQAMMLNTLVKDPTAHSENEFLTEAYQQGYYTHNEGTTQDDYGKILERHGCIVERKESSFAELAARLNGGEVAQVSVNGGILWNSRDPKHLGDIGPNGEYFNNHSVMVSGLRIGITPEGDRVVKGVWVNDSGNGEAKEVDVDRFEKAWDASQNYLAYARMSEAGTSTSPPSADVSNPSSDDTEETEESEENIREDDILESGQNLN